MDKLNIDYILEQCIESIARNSSRFDTGRPVIGEGLCYKLNQGDDILPDNWVEGFWPGQLWLAYELSKNEDLLKAARAYQPYFIKRFECKDLFTHDVGFIYSLSMVSDYKVTASETAKTYALQAAETLADRFNPQGKFIRAWNPWPKRDNAGRIIIDTMENLSLLFWASQVTKEPRFADIASAHAKTSAKHLIRENGSCFHCFDFDPNSGRPLGGATHQGYSDSSCWSRGQAWGIHGFAQAYAYTHESIFLESSKKIADYALRFLKETAVPIWDYHLPETEIAYRDSSAGAITAAGLLLLAEVVNDGEHYKQEALRILEALVNSCAIFHIEEAEGLLKHGVRHVPNGQHDNMLPYGDYFFLEALLRAKGRKNFYW